MIFRTFSAIHRLGPCAPIRRIQARSLSSTAIITAPAKSDRTSIPTHEQNIISQLTPMKKILCLCPIPLGRGRILWSGGDTCDQTIHMDFQGHESQTQQKVAKYRYGEKYVIGAAISDAYLTHAEPVPFNKDGVNGYVAETVPSFRCDTHNLGSSPIFYTNLPYFRNELLRDIGHYDIGAVVIAMPMKPTANPFHPSPTRVQIEQEQNLEVVRDSIMKILQNYVSQRADNFDNTAKSHEADTNSNGKRCEPLGLQGFINDRLSLSEVLSKSYDSDCGSWGHITKILRQIQNQHTIGGGRSSEFAYNQIHGSHHVFTSIPPQIHAAVALNAMMEKYASSCYGLI